MSDQVIHAHELEADMESNERWTRSNPANRWRGHPVTNGILTVHASVPTGPEELAKEILSTPQTGEGLV